MKLQILSIAAIITAGIIMSTDGCKEYNGNEDAYNEGWEDYADTVNVEEGFEAGEGLTCSIDFDEADGSWVEEYAHETISEFIGNTGPYEYETEIICGVEMFEKDSEIYYAFSAWDSYNEPDSDNKYLDIYNCQKELVESGEMADDSEVANGDVDYIREFSYSQTYVSQ